MQVFDDNEMLNQALIQPLPGDVGDDDLERELDDLLASNRNAVGVSTPVRPIVDHKIPQFGQYLYRQFIHAKELQWVIFSLVKTRV